MKHRLVRRRGTRRIARGSRGLLATVGHDLSRRRHGRALVDGPAICPCRWWVAVVHEIPFLGAALVLQLALMVVDRVRERARRTELGSGVEHARRRVGLSTLHCLARSREGFLMKRQFTPVRRLGGAMVAGRSKRLRLGARAWRLILWRIVVPVQQVGLCGQTGILLLRHGRRWRISSSTAWDHGECGFDPFERLSRIHVGPVSALRAERGASAGARLCNGGGLLGCAPCLP